MTGRGAVDRAMGLAMLVLVGRGCAASIPDNSNPGGSGGNPSGAGGASGTGGQTGAGGASYGSGGTSAGAGGSSSVDAGHQPDGSADASGGDAGPPPCFLNLMPLSAPSFLAEVESGIPFRVRGQANVAPAASAQADQWAWDITLPPSLTPLPPDMMVIHPAPFHGDSATVEFTPMFKGTYSISARISNRPACGSVTRPLNVIAPLPAAFTVRVFPPASLPSPVQEFRLTRQQLPGGVVLDSQVQRIRIFAYDDMFQPLPAYMQITSPGSTLVIEGNTRRGPMSVDLIQRTYDLLLIPAGNFAPKLLSGLPNDLALLANTISFDAGINVSGQTLRANGTPVADARLVLRDGVRPSTVGISDSGGAFSLFTREGNLSVEIAAPPNSGLPDGHVDAGAGVTLAPNATGTTLTMRWAALPAGALKLTIRSPDGATVVARPTVHVELAAPIATAGQLTLHTTAASVVLPVSGSLHADAVGDDKGTVTFPALPAGSYRVTVVPPATAGATAAITSATVDVVAAGVTRDVRIAQKITLGGTLQPVGTSKGVRITAIDTGSDIVTSTVSTVVGDGGRYQLVVNPGRTYKLWAVPGADQMFARAVLGTMPAPLTDQALPTFTLAAGLATASAVRAGAPVADALIQVFCPLSSSTCADTTLPIAEAVTDPNGLFTVVLPDTGP